MTSTRLLNLHTYELEPYEIGDMPSYVAISHVWSERFFPISAKGDPQTAEGIPMIRQIFKDSRYPITSYCWIDTWCIDQGDDLTDKFEQIYRMADIYKQAQLVIIIVRHTFTFSQDQWDAATAGCRDLLDSAFFEGEGWATRVAMVTPASVSAFSDLLLMIEELAQLKWPTRIWTAQEYILAKSDAWIGLDLQPLTLPAQDIWSVCEAVLWRDRQDSLLHPELHASYRFPPIVGVVNWNLYLMNMVKTRSSGICLQAMLLAGTRQCAEPVDEIYGLMAASGVVIAPIRGESAAAAWKRWWEHSIVSGDFGFLLTYSTLFRPVRDWNCAMPPFDVRCQLGNLTRSSRIPWGPVTVNPSDGTITLIGRIAGHLTIDKKLSSAGGAGGVTGLPRSLHHLQDLCSGDLGLMMRLLTCIAAGKTSRHSALVAAETAHQAYQLRHLSLSRALSGTETTRLQELEASFSMPLNYPYARPSESVYLGTLRNEFDTTNVLFSTEQELVVGEGFLGLDVADVETGMGRGRGSGSTHRQKLLLVVREPRDGGRAMHKMGIAYSVLIHEGGGGDGGGEGWGREDGECEQACHVEDRTLHEFKIGGGACEYCADCRLREEG